MEEYIKKILHESLNYCREVIDNSNGFYPFGMYLTSENEVKLLDLEFEKNEPPTYSTLMNWIENLFKEDLYAGKIEAYAIISDQSLKIEEEKPPIDCICIDVRNKIDAQPPLFYFPYKYQENEGLIIGELFGVKR